MKFGLLFCLSLASCNPKASFRESDRALIIVQGRFSCLRGSCCFPYYHHYEVKEIRAMVCTEETFDPHGWHSLQTGIKAYFRDP